ncbi:class I SAM-dependent methyltransferase [Amycolatopsis anabasis]|uniref:class I SAM-dependent methyltransferase n=1 Tax=Amycolatopsis anabasis TaxID=1840409 RepID=UPI00131E26F5|nr:class I SAM-dependent methyltransferase [Amycolatopsis anabasis]
MAETKPTAKGMQNLNRLSKPTDRLHLAGTGTGPDYDDQEAAKAKAAISSVYDMIAATWSLGDLWNWGLYDPKLLQEVEEIIPDFTSFGTDGFSELLYFYTLRQVPLDIADYRGKRVLEVGSGIGAGLNFLSRVAGGAEMSGVDISKTAVERANARYSRGEALSYTVGDAESLPFDDGVFDVVINVESSHSYPSLGNFFGEVARVLKPGGYLSLVDAFTEHRANTFNKTMPECARLEWLADNDISPQVSAAVRQRMAPGSYLRQSFAKQRMSPLKRVVGKHGLMAALGAPFTGDASMTPLAKWSRKVSGLAISDKAPVRTYRHYLATRVS